MLRPVLAMPVFALAMACSPQGEPVAVAPSCADAPAPGRWGSVRAEQMGLGLAAPSGLYADPASAEYSALVAFETGSSAPRGMAFDVTVVARVADRNSSWLTAEWEATQRYIAGRNGAAPSGAGAIAIAGYTTYETWRRDGMAHFSFAQEAGPGSGWCWLESASDGDGICEFSLLDEPRGVSLQIRLPAHVASALPRVVADLEPTIAHVSRHC